MKRLFSRIFRMFKRYKFIDSSKLVNTGSCNVIIVNDDATDISNAFGITMERLDELRLDYKDKIDANTTNVDRIRIMSELCKHPNELAVSCFLIGASYELQKIMGGIIINVGGKNGNDK